MQVSNADLWAIKKYFNLDEGVKDVLGDSIKQDPLLHVLVEQARIARQNLMDALNARLED